MGMITNEFSEIWDSFEWLLLEDIQSGQIERFRDRLAAMKLEMRVFCKNSGYRDKFIQKKLNRFWEKRSNQVVNL